ncbi:MAG: recombinase family protein [Pseudonocardiales bacterium]
MANRKNHAKPNKRRKRKGVAYIRVSHLKQVKREFNPEGISLPQQRQAVKSKADTLGVELLEVFKEEGRSGKTVDQRPEFQRMLAYIKERGDIDYVIVDSLSRTNRNRIEDALMLVALRAAGVEVVSATEPIDETPAGQLLHGILASVNEFRSVSDGNDVSRKMEYKASIGGTPGRAKIGYLNIRQSYDGRQVATVIIDDKRGPLIQMAFELYATGTYTIDTLTEVLQEAGLTSLPHGQRPVRPIARSKVATILRDRYYIGYVQFNGNEYVGRHPKLITPELFHRVQELLDSQSGAGIRNRKHHHYLKGALSCHRCGRRLVFAVAKETYAYFFCVGRRDDSCNLPYLAASDVEIHVTDHYATIDLPPEFRAVVEAAFDTELETNLAATAHLRESINKRLGELSVKEDHYLDLVGDPDWPKDKLTAKMQGIRDERDKLMIELDKLDTDLSVARDIFTTALTLLAKPQKLYRALTDSQRKLLNAILFTKITVDAHGVTGEQFAEPFDALVPLGRYYARHGALPATPTADTPQATADPQADPTDDYGQSDGRLTGRSSNKATYVPPAGFEPATHGLGRAVSSAYRPATSDYSSRDVAPHRLLLAASSLRRCCQGGFEPFPFRFRSPVLHTCSVVIILELRQNGHAVPRSFFKQREDACCLIFEPAQDRSAKDQG